jgi:hypothetical protein
MSDPKSALPKSEVAIRAAKLWPHREHEANSVLGLLCRIGLHRWRRDLTAVMPCNHILHCFWCSKVKVDAIVYDP